MVDSKTLLSLISVLLTFIGCFPYVRDTLKNKITPHVYSWFIWGFVTFMIFSLQIRVGAGVGAWTTLSVCLISFFIFIVGLKKGKQDITKTDTDVVTTLFPLTWTIANGLFSIMLIVRRKQLGNK